MNKLITGNLGEQVAKHPETKGWFLGSFMEKHSDFYSEDLELKWIRHEKGFHKPGFSSEHSIKTLTVLISGKYRVVFHDFHQEVVLEKLGDFLYYDSSQTTHDADALEDTLLLVIRWPSLKKD